MIESPAGTPQAGTPQPTVQQAASQAHDNTPGRKRKRRTLKRKWPEAGTILQADYHGQHYEAEVVRASQYSSGLALRILTGPSAGKVHHSFSGAMLEATEMQREQEGLGTTGMANGWAFWKAKED